MAQKFKSSKTGCNRFLSNRDRFANPINLSYNHKKVYQTPYGGFMTFVVAIVIIGWFTSQVLNVINVAFTETELWEERSVSGDQTNNYISTTQMLPTFGLISTNTTALSDDEVQRYFSGVYVQQITEEGNVTDTRVIPAVKCNDIVDATFATKLSDGFYCPNMTDDMVFKGYTGIDFKEMKRFKLILGTCSNLSSLTNKTDCVSYEESLKFIDKVVAKYNVWVQFFNPYYYMRDTAYGMQYQNFYQETSFSSIQFQETPISLSEQKVTFKYWWLSSAFFKKEFNIFTPQYAQTGLYNVASTKATENGVNALLCLSFTIDCVVGVQTVVRTNFLFLVGSLGSLTYMLRNIGNAVTKGGTAFGLDNSMIKRLYSMNRKVDGHSVDIQEEEGRNTGRTEFIDTLDKRGHWSYNWKRRNCAPEGYNCCRICCCRPKTREDRLFERARETLHNEIDMLHIIKQMRINTFAMEMLLNKGQRGLVNFFDKYNIGSDSSSEDDKAKPHSTITESDDQDSRVQIQISSADSEAKINDAELSNQFLAKSQKRRSVKFFEDHHYLVDEEMRAQVKEVLTNFDCSKNIIDQLILAKLVGYDDQRNVLNMLCQKSKLDENYQSDDQGPKLGSLNDDDGPTTQAPEIINFVHRSEMRPAISPRVKQTMLKGQT